MTKQVSTSRVRLSKKQQSFRLTYKVNRNKFLYSVLCTGGLVLTCETCFWFLTEKYSTVLFQNIFIILVLTYCREFFQIFPSQDGTEKKSHIWPKLCEVRGIGSWNVGKKYTLPNYEKKIQPHFLGGGGHFWLSYPATPFILLRNQGQTFLIFSQNESVFFGWFSNFRSRDPTSDRYSNFIFHICYVIEIKSNCGGSEFYDCICTKKYWRVIGSRSFAGGKKFFAELKMPKRKM